MSIKRHLPMKLVLRTRQSRKLRKPAPTHHPARDLKTSRGRNHATDGYCSGGGALTVNDAPQEAQKAALDDVRAVPQLEQKDGAEIAAGTA